MTNLTKSPWQALDFSEIPLPAFIIDEAAVEQNLMVLQDVANRSGAKILAALKAFSYWPLGELTGQYLHGICASGLHEAKLGHEFYRGSNGQGEVHVYSAGFTEKDLKEILTFADHLVFNSFSQLRKFKTLVLQAKTSRDISVGLRINPEHSEGATEMYDPCAKGSRLGTSFTEFAKQDDLQDLLAIVDGFHFHTLCEQGFGPLSRTLDAVEEKFAAFLPKLKWLNLGGGHHITAEGYDRDALVERLKALQQKYNVQAYLEPGEAIAIHTGVLAAEVLDVFHSAGLEQAILSASATCHMPDTLEMPYRADIIGSGVLGEKPYNYRLGGLSCLAGDVMGDYSFDAPLTIGQILLFDDMSHYTMVKTTTFNGTKLPAIVLYDGLKKEIKKITEFDYQDFKTRLG